MAELRVTCPKCQSQYRMKAAPPAGAKLNCTKCGASFLFKGTTSGPANGPTTPAPRPAGKAATSAAAGPQRAVAPRGREALANSAATPAAPARRNWEQIAALGAVGGLLVVCAVLATLLWTSGGDDERIEARPLAEAAVAEETAAGTAPATEQERDGDAAAASTESDPSSGSTSAPIEPATASPAASNASTANQPQNLDAPSGAADDSVDADNEDEDDNEQAATVAESTPPEAAAAKNGLPRYRWRRGDVLPYRFEVSAEVADKVITHAGLCQLETSAWATDAPRKVKVETLEEIEAAEEYECTGSAFVVHPDGYLATCAHVVEDAKTISLRLGEEDHAAEVVAIDAVEDLALLKIKATKLKTLSLANSDAVRLGEDVRALGYPLSDVLGGNLKVTAGIVSGIVQEGEAARFQIDAALNPGNSGGPVINDRGEVIGVSSSGIFGPMVSDLGFAAPANRLRAMLKKQQLKSTPTAAAAETDGASLVARASECMALVKVVMGPPPPRQTHIVTFTATTQSTETSKDDGRIGFSMDPRIPSSKYQQGKLVVDEFGRLADVDGESLLPGTVRCMKGLMVEPLDPDGQRQWEEEETLRLGIEDPMQTAASRFGRVYHGTPPHMVRGPFGGNMSFEATLRTKYRVLEKDGDQLVIEKRQSLESAEGEPIDLSVTGKGTFTFDGSQGCVTKMDYRQTVRSQNNNLSFEIPVHITYELLSAADFVAERLPAAKSSVRRSEERRARDATLDSQTAEERVDGLLRSIERQLKSGERHISEVSELGELDVVASRQAKVAKALLALAASDSSPGTSSALRALEKWADANCVPALIKMMESGDRFTTTAVAEILGNLGDARAAEPLAAALAAEGFGGFQITAALKKLGPAAEVAVLPLLKNDDEHVRREACEILGEVGGPKSVKALRALLSKSQGDRDTFVRMEVERALEDIQRQGANAAALEAIGAKAPSADVASKRGLDQIREILADRSAGDRERQSALRSLEELMPPDETTRKQVAALVAPLLKSSTDQYLRMLAVQALAKWGGPENEEQLLSLLGDGYAAGPTIAALGRVGGERTAQRLLTELRRKKNDEFVAGAIAVALGNVAVAGPIEDEILELLDDEDVVLRTLAIKALGGMDSDRARESVAKALASEETDIELVAAIEAAARQAAREE